MNVAEDYPFAEFETLYVEAWKAGLKGITTYRPNAVLGSVLSVSSEPAKETGLQVIEPLDRPEALEGQTYKIKWPESAHAIYITLNDVMVDGKRRPFEVFINSKNMEHYAWTVALTRMISAVFRRGGDVSFVVEELKAVFDPRGGAWMGGRYVPSMLAAIGEVIERHMVDIGFLKGKGLGLKTDPHAEDAVVPKRPMGEVCPDCGAQSMVRSEGCMNCLECGYSKCS